MAFFGMVWENPTGFLTCYGVNEEADEPVELGSQ